MRMLLGNPPPILRLPLPDDQRGATRETLKWMRSFVRAGKCNPLVRYYAVGLTYDLPPKNRAMEIRMLFEFVRDEIRFVHDPADVEMLHWPEAVLQMGSGDCDDKVILLCSLLESIGYPTRLVAVGFRPGEFSHVYCEVKFRDRWLPLDASVESASPGWCPSNPAEIMIARNSC
jgi:transglutaminase-like putative cysteine protease